MKIAFLGNFAVDYTSESHYAKTFEKLGHQVIRLQEPQVRTDDVYAIAKTCDMFFWVHTHGWELQGNRTMAEVLRKLDGMNIPTVAYHLDLYMGLRRWTEYENSDYFKVKHFFTVDKLMADWLNENTQTIGHYLPAGVYEEECYTGDFDQRFNFDVVFVGSKRYHEEWQYRPQLVNWLEQTFGRRFGHFGNDGIVPLRGAALNNLYASAKVVVGDTLCIGFDYPYYWSDRIYETTGRGGFMIHPYIKGLETEFEDGAEVLFYEYGNFEQLKEKIVWALENDAKRKFIQQAGHERTKAEHTYTQRLQTIIERVKA